MNAPAIATTDLNALFSSPLFRGLKRMLIGLIAGDWEREQAIRAWDLSWRFAEQAAASGHEALVVQANGLARQIAVAVREKSTPARTALDALRRSWSEIEKLQRALAPKVESGRARVVYLHGDGARLGNTIGSLAARNIELVRCDDGQTWLTALREGEPRLLVIDSEELPQALGVSLCARARELLRARGLDAPIALVSGAVDVARRIELLKVGVSAHLAGNIDPAEAIGRLLDLLSEAEADPLRILLIDDDRSQTMICEASLKRAGCVTRAVNQSSEALDALAAFAPDVVLVDLHMPEISGIELTRLIRESPQHSETPVLFLSGERDFALRVDAIRVGGDDFLLKPVQPHHLVSLVTSRGRRARSRRLDRLSQQAPQQSTGLVDRLGLLERLEAALGSGERGTLALMRWAGDSGSVASWARLNQLLVERLQSELGSSTVLARNDERSVLALAISDEPPERLRSRLRAAVSELSGDAGQSVELGIVPLRSQLRYATVALQAAERALSQTDTRPRKLDTAAIAAAAPVRRLDVDALRLALAQRFDEADMELRLLRFDPAPARLREPPLSWLVLRWRDASQNGRVFADSDTLRAALSTVSMRERVDRHALNAAMRALAEPGFAAMSGRVIVDQSLELLKAVHSARVLVSDLERAGITARRLILAVRAEDVMTDPKQARRCLDELRSAGVQIGLANLGESLVSYKLGEFIPVQYGRVAERILREGERRAEASLKQAIEAARKHRLILLLPRLPQGLDFEATVELGADWVARED